MLQVVVDEPIRFRIDRHVHLRIVHAGDSRQYDGRAIRLHSRTIIKSVHILEEDAHRYLLIGIVACKVDADERDELDLGMRLQKAHDFLLWGICRNHI